MKAEYDPAKMKSRRNPYAARLKKRVTTCLSEDVRSARLITSINVNCRSKASIWRWIVFIWTALLTVSAKSEVYRCKPEGGPVTYSDTPCPNALKQEGASWVDPQEDVLKMQKLVEASYAEKQAQRDKELKRQDAIRDAQERYSRRDLLKKYGKSNEAAYSNFWEEEEWKICRDTFLSLHPQTLPKKIISYMYQDGVCDFGEESLPPIKPGQCYLVILGSGALFPLNHKIDMYCYGHQGSVCTTAPDYYRSDIEDDMRSNPRCEGFPDFLNIRVRPKLTPEEVEEWNRYNNTGLYEDLPEWIRFGNRNTDNECRPLVNEIRRLENDPNWDRYSRIQKEWRSKYEKAMKMGCEL